MHIATAFAGTFSGTLLADPTDDLNSVIDGAGPLSFVFFAFLAVALFFIIRSMNRQFKKVNKDLPPGKADRRRAFDESIIQQAEVRGEEQAAATGNPSTGTASDATDTTAEPDKGPQA